MDGGEEGNERRWDLRTDAGTAVQCVTIPSLIAAPPPPRLSVAPSLTRGPSHNLCPLSDRTETQEWTGRQDCVSVAAYIEIIVLQQYFCLSFELWPRSPFFAVLPLSSGDYQRNGACACDYVCVRPALWLLLKVLGLAAGVDHHERWSPSARVWVSAPVQKTAPQMWLLLCPSQRYVNALIFRTFTTDVLDYCVNTASQVLLVLLLLSC